MGKLSKQDSSIKKKAELIQAADSIGKKIQYDCPGFLPNRREHRMAGFAAIEIAQKVSKAWRSMQPECSKRVNIPSQNRGGAGCSTSATLETSSWQDIYSVTVKWRQISEPCDPVVWVNKLSKDFNSGFRPYTPMICEQAQVVRYFPNYERTLNVAKTVMKERPFVYSQNNDIIDLSKDGKLEDIMHANSCSDLYRVVGEDFWLPTWCYSTASEGQKLEGTRICLAKMGERGFDFAIRTQCTPDRLRDFDTEMALAWEAICNAYSGENYGSSDFDVRDAILRMTYY